MARLQENAGMSQSQLGEKTLKDRHSINRIINILERRSYIERRSDKEDKRAYQLFLTKSGTAILKKSTPIFLKHYERRFSGFNADDLDHLRRMLGKIMKNIESIEADNQVPDGICKKRNPTINQSKKRRTINEVEIEPKRFTG